MFPMQPLQPQLSQNYELLKRVAARRTEPGQPSGTSEAPVLIHNVEGPPPGTGKPKITTGHANLLTLIPRFG